MRKITLALALAIVVAAAAFAAPSAQAQAATYPTVSDRVPFSPECNFMSKAGYLRFKYFQTSGNLISYEEAYTQVQAQGG